MIKKISRIKFSDFQTQDDLIYYLIENDIHQLIDDNEVKFNLSDITEIWKKYKDNFKRKFDHIK